MKMLKLGNKKVFIITLLSIFVLLTIMKYNFYRCKNCSPQNYVYGSYETGLEFKLLCKVPKNIHTFITEKKVYYKDEYEILRFEDKRFSAIRTYYFLKQKNVFLILRDPNVETKNVNINSTNYNNFIINYQVFNRCVNIFWNDRKNNVDFVLNKFCFFLSNSFDKNSTIEIQSTNDIEKLSKIHKIPNLEKVILNHKKIFQKRETDSINSKFYWFKDKGLLKISFVKNNSSKAIEIISVESLGYFGNEQFSL